MLYKKLSYMKIAENYNLRNIYLLLCWIAKNLNNLNILYIAVIKRKKPKNTKKVKIFLEIIKSLHYMQKLNELEKLVLQNKKWYNISIVKVSQPSTIRLPCLGSPRQGYFWLEFPSPKTAKRHTCIVSGWRLNFLI